MGKYIILITIAAALSVTLLASQGYRTDLDTSQAQSARQKKVLSRQIARSVFRKGVSEVKRNFDSITEGVQDGSYENGTYVLEYDTTSSGGERIVAITAEGTYGEATYEITGKARKTKSVSDLFNAITANVPITFNVSGGGCSGGPCVSGLDDGGREDRHGISLPSSGNASNVCNEFDGKVVGKESGCDVATRTSEMDEWIADQMERLESEIQSAMDRGSEDIVECNDCKVDNLADTSGILYVTGELRFNGEEQWDGLVFVKEGGTVRINGGGSTRNINGGLILEDSTDFEEDEEFDMNGGNAVQYNSQTLLDFVNTLPSIESTAVSVTNRSERFVRE